MILVSSVNSGPAFVTIDSSTQPPRVKIQTAAYSDTGTYTIEVVVTETNSGVVDVQTFQLLVTCLTALAPVPKADVEYYISDPAITETFAFALTPSGCPNEL